MRIIRQFSPKFCLFAFILLCSQLSQAELLIPEASGCVQSYFEQTLPKITNKKFAQDTLPLCFDGFAVMYSGVSKTALWSAESLTRQKIEQASKLERVNNFHPEARLPNSIRAELADYSHSPYDRGHLAPNGDMATTTQQYDSFSLANIVPQNPIHNRNLWKNLETHTRYLAIKYGQVYVVTGVAFLGSNIKQLNQRILVPTHLYKAIYVPSIQQAGVYFSPNDDSQRVEVLSLSQLEQRIGMSVFPDLPDTVKSTAMPLPTSNQDLPDKRMNDKQVLSPDEIVVLLVNLFTAIMQWLSNVLKE